MQKLKAIESQLRESPGQQISLSGPDSRSMARAAEALEEPDTLHIHDVRARKKWPHRVAYGGFKHSRRAIDKKQVRPDVAVPVELVR